MTDRDVTYPNRYKLALVSGTTDTYTLTPSPGTINAEGTPLSKASLLTDTTAAALGLISGDPTVNEALYRLRQTKAGRKSTFQLFMTGQPYQGIY